MKRRAVLTLTAAAVATAAMTAPVRADDAFSLAIGQRGSWEPMIAQQGFDQGIFKRAGIDLKLSYTAGGSDTIAAVTGGGADFGFAVGTTAVIAAFAKGAPIKIVSASFTGANDIYFYVRNESPIQKIADTTGKTFAFTRPGSSSFTIAHAAADAAKVQPNFVAGGDLQAILTQVLSGQIDVGLSGAPQFFDLIQQKKIRMIGRGSEAKALDGVTVRVNIAHTSVLRDRHEAAVRFFKAYSDTIGWMYKNLNQSVVNYARYTELPVDIAKGVVPFYPLRAVALAPVNGFNRSIDEAVDLKFIPAPLTADQQKAIFDILPPH
jgi:NitT/TauT family transport system substrate-binding protein